MNPPEKNPLAGSHRAGAILPAAGFGTRMQSEQPKQFLQLAGKPVLVRTIQAFLKHPAIEHVVLVLPDEFLDRGRRLLDSFFPDTKQISCVIGGRTRQQSVFNGLQAMPPAITALLVHDGARPLVSSEIIDRCLEGIKQHRAVIAAVPVKDTLKEITNTTILNTVDRAQLWQAQTPQAMERTLLEKAYSHAKATGFTGTDEASLLEHASIAVHVVAGSENNFKITRPNDLAIANGLLAHERRPMKIGHGYDAHRLIAGRKLILGGVEIPHHLGLEGHSDADVLTHALMDAMIGAMGAGDIGRHFPDTDQAYLNADSLHLLAAVIRLTEKNRYRLVNADLTIICQKPRLAPYLATMEANLARVCATETNCINIKATTTEKMGFTGRGEGISAHAVVLMQSL